MSSVSRTIRAVLACAALAAGCKARPASPVPPPPLPVVPAESVTAPSPPARLRTLDDRFVGLAREVPGGFGGFWLLNDRLHAFLVDTTQAAAAQRVLGERLRGEFGTGADGQRARVPLDAIVFHRARYDFAALDAWHRRLLAELDHTGVFSTDVAESENRITVAVRTAQAAERVRRRAAALGIPRAALHVAVVSVTNEW